MFVAVGLALLTIRPWTEILVVMNEEYSPVMPSHDGKLISRKVREGLQAFINLELKLTLALPW